MLSVLLSVLLVMLSMSVLGVAASAKTTVLASGTCGENITWSLTSDKTLTFSGTGAVEPQTRTNDEEETEYYFPWSDALYTLFLDAYGVDTFDQAMGRVITGVIDPGELFSG